MDSFRTNDDITRVKYIENCLDIANGNPFITPDNLAFAQPDYLALKKIKNLQMAEMNAGAIIVQQFVADTLTDLQIESGQEEEIRQWMDEVDFMEAVEEWLTNYLGGGDGILQIIGTEDGYTPHNISPVDWYPELPVLSHQKVKKSKVISTYKKMVGNNLQWFAYVETYDADLVLRELYRIKDRFAISGDLETKPDFTFEELEENSLGRLPFINMSRKRKSRSFFGESIFAPIWEQLRELNEMKLDIRKERIKHGNAKMVMEQASAMRAQRKELEDIKTSKERELYENYNLYDLNQDIFFVSQGSQVPAYIQRDLKILETIPKLIDKELSEIASIVGMPKSVFNIDERADVHVETEKKKDRRYMRNVLGLQRTVEKVIKKAIEMKYEMDGQKVAFEVSLSNPFGLTKKELAEELRIGNSTDAFISQEQAVDEYYADKDEAFREQIKAQLKESKQQPVGAFQQPVDVTL